MTNDSNVKALYAIRMGSLALLSATEARQADGSSYFDQMNREAEDLLQRFRDAPMVVEEPAAKWDLNRMSLTPLHNQGKLRWAAEFSPALRIKVHWPRKNQDLDSFRPYRGTCVEDFNIIYDGMNFVVVARCTEPLPRAYSFDFGREARRILESIIPKSSVYQVEYYGPTPIFPIVYIAVADELPDPPIGRPLINEGHTRESVLQLLPNERPQDDDNEVLDIAASILSPMSTLTHALAFRDEFGYQQYRLLNHLEAATNSYAARSTPLQWRSRRWFAQAMTRFTESRAMRRSVAAAYGHYVQMEEAKRNLLTSVRDAEAAFKNHPALEPHADYCMEEVEDSIEYSGHHLLEGLRFFAEEARSSSLESTTLLAAVAGGFLALVGAAVGYLLAG